MKGLIKLFVEGLTNVLGQELEKSEGSLISRASTRLVLNWVARFLERAASPELFGALGFAVIVAALIIIVSLTVHLAIGRRHARVFISFQHDGEPIAAALSSQIEKSGVTPIRLPFVENPDHDTLLDQVKQAIRKCDVFVCLPGERPSFVESEVLMAFGLEKPMLFVLTEAETSRLPNTAKKGYPMFALERLQSESFRTLANFCSYLAADWRSTARLYGAIFGLSFKALSIAAMLAYFFSIMAMLGIMGPTALPKAIRSDGSLMMWADGVIHDPPTFCFVLVWLVICLVPYAVLVITRLRLRTKIRRAITTKRFSESLFRAGFLSQALDYSLAGAELLKLLHTSEILAEHQSDKPQLRNA